MGIHQRLRDWDEQFCCLLEGHRFAKVFLECASGQVFHHKELCALIHPIVGYLGYVGVGELRHLLGFVLEALDHASQNGRGKFIHADEFDGHIDLQVHMAGSIHLRHAAPADQFKDLVAFYGGALLYWH